MDWFNSVDTEYQRQFRETNELNWERFKAYVDARLAEVRRDLEAAIAGSEKGLRADFADLRSEFADLRSEFVQSRSDIRSELAALRSDMMKWMFIYWTGSIVALGGLMLGLLYPR